MMIYSTRKIVDAKIRVFDKRYITPDPSPPRTVITGYCGTVRYLIS